MLVSGIEREIDRESACVNEREKRDFFFIFEAATKKQENAIIKAPVNIDAYSSASSAN